MITIADAIRSCNKSTHWELKGNPLTEEKFNASFTNHDSDNPLTWAEVKAKFDELTDR
jgi:hypothetical protein